MNICFIGGGNMASALIGGLLKDDLYSREDLSAVEIDADNRARLQQNFGIKVSAALDHGISASDVIVLAVKPQQLHALCTQLAPLLQQQLIISIAAGVRAQDIAGWLGTGNIIRCMPNTPALVGKGVTGLYALPEVSATHKEVAENILACVGSTLWLDEEMMMDGLTAISGSGPAYVFYFIEAMQQAAREQGFDEAKARKLVLDTFSGALQLAQESQDDAATLRARVTSKNGTTERAILSMESKGVKAHIIAAAQAAAQRSREMGDELGGKTC